MKGFTLVLSLAMTACSTCPAPRLQEVPVPTPCLPAGVAPAPPELVADSAMKLMPDGDLVLALDVNRLRLQAYVAQLEAALAGCR